ncbi:MAG TPA: amidohydrolase [Trebonia sp.]|jgi:amidohydrolase
MTTPAYPEQPRVHAAIDKEIADLTGRLTELSLDLHAHPELSLREHRSADLLKTWLADEGFSVQAPVAGLDTAFVAQAGPAGGTGSGEPVIAYLLEYDALPGVGHGCGHNLIAAGGLGAATALHRALRDGVFQGTALPGTLRVIGTPGEEGKGGKVTELEAGVFDDVDAALMFHPANTTMMIRHSLASQPMTVKFHGKSAHAAGSPTEGRSALAAMIQLFVAIDALRQFLPDLSRVHGVILDGGKAANVIPAYTEAEFQVRGVTSGDAQEHVDRVIACAEAAAAATGTTVEIERHPFYAERKNNRVMAERTGAYLEAQGEQVAPPVLRGGVGSSDVGNVSLKLPTIHPYLRITRHEAPGHSLEMARAAASPYAQEAMLRMATALAKTGADLFGEPGMLDAARREFAERGPDLPAG